MHVNAFAINNEDLLEIEVKKIMIMIEKIVIFIKTRISKSMKLT